MTVVRESAYVRFIECEPIINLLKNSTGQSEAQIADAAGWSDSVLSKGRRDGKIRLGVKYSLIGLASELGLLKDGHQTKPAFSFDELGVVFAGLLDLKRKSPGNAEVKDLLIKVAKELSR